MGALHFKQYRRPDSYLVDDGAATIGFVWRGCGRTTWAGSRYASDTEAHGHTRREVAEKLRALPRLYTTVLTA